MDSSLNIIDLEYLRNPIYSTSKLSLKGAPMKKEDLDFYKIRIYQMTKDLVLDVHINDKINAAFNNYARTCIQHFKFIDMRQSYFLWYLRHISYYYQIKSIDGH